MLLFFKNLSLMEFKEWYLASSANLKRKCPFGSGLLKIFLTLNKMSQKHISIMGIQPPPAFWIVRFINKMCPFQRALKQPFSEYILIYFFNFD